MQIARVIGSSGNELRFIARGLSSLLRRVFRTFVAGIVFFCHGPILVQPLPHFLYFLYDNFHSFSLLFSPVVCHERFVFLLVSLLFFSLAVFNYVYVQQQRLLLQFTLTSCFLYFLFSFYCVCFVLSFVIVIFSPFFCFHSITIFFYREYCFF